ncbi:hypothetical protein LTR95_007247, partial [Oleoguttula sp. CCFEE 5521]
SDKMTTETADNACRSLKDLIPKIRNKQRSEIERWQILCDSLSNDEVWKNSAFYNDHDDDKFVPWCSPNEEQSGTFQRVSTFKIRTLLKPPRAESPLELYAQIGIFYLRLSQVVMDPILRWLLVDFLDLKEQFLREFGTQPSCWLQEKFREEDFDMKTLAGRRYMDERETEELLSRATNRVSPRATDGVLSRATDEVLSRASVQHSWNWVPKRMLELWEWVKPCAVLRATPRPKAFVGSDVA